MSQPTYLVKTLGCKANLVDSQKLEAELQRRGWASALPGTEDQASLCIVNSCTVTDEADRQSRKMARRLGREMPQAQVVFTGCGAEVDPEGLLKAGVADVVVGNQDKGRLLDLIEQSPEQPGSVVLGSAKNYGQMLSRHPQDREWPVLESAFEPSLLNEGESSRTRAFLKIQDGCNSFCTYCIIPYGRGPSRSLSIEAMVKQVQTLVEQGVRELVLTGINLGDFGVDWNGGRPALTTLVQALLEQTELERLRVSSLDPVEIEDDLIALMRREPRFCPHFHVSLQSPESRVLRLMKRKYQSEQVEDCLTKISRIPAPVGGAFVGMDVITGFPGEGEEEFSRTVESLSRLPWTRLHVFPYSERSGTPATRLPGVVPQTERQRRGKVLRELSLERMRSTHQQVLDHCRVAQEPLRGVLLEGAVKGPDGTRNWISGYTPNYLRVMIRADSDLQGKLSNQVRDFLPEQLVVDSNSGDCAFIGALLGKASE